MLGDKRRGWMVKELKEKTRGGTLDEVKTKEIELAEQIFRLKFQMANGEANALRKIRELRRDLARVKTILREREFRTADEKKS